jgi:TRAP transporter TAXI family solute receptor
LCSRRFRISSSHPIRFISFTPEEQEKLAYAFSPIKITSAEYNFVSEPVDTVRDLQTVLVSNKVSDEAVYQITKTVYENWDDVVSVAPAAGKVSYKDAVYLKVPIHPGAIKYFEEKGVTIPDELK